MIRNTSKYIDDLKKNSNPSYPYEVKRILTSVRKKDKMTVSPRGDVIDQTLRASSNITNKGYSVLGMRYEPSWSVGKGIINDFLVLRTGNAKGALLFLP